MHRGQGHPTVRTRAGERARARPDRKRNGRGMRGSAAHARGVRSDVRVRRRVRRDDLRLAQPARVQRHQGLSALGGQAGRGHRVGRGILHGRPAPARVPARQGVLPQRHRRISRAADAPRQGNGRASGTQRTAGRHARVAGLRGRRGGQGGARAVLRARRGSGGAVLGLPRRVHKRALRRAPPREHGGASGERRLRRRAVLRRRRRPSRRVAAQAGTRWCTTYRAYIPPARSWWGR